MRTSSLALLAVSLLAGSSLVGCSGDDGKAPPADATAAATVAPTVPATSDTSEDAPAEKKVAEEKAESPTTESAPAKPADEAPAADPADLAGAAQTFQACLTACKDAACIQQCMTDLKTNLPEAPAGGGGNAAMCCKGTAFFVCPGAGATCDGDADDPGPGCQEVPAMTLMCGGQQE